MTTTTPLRLYWHPLSGHAHRVELFLSLLNLPFERVTVDLFARQQKTPEYLAKNPWGQVPVIEDGDVTLPDSNAILVYLAKKYDPSGTWLPADPVGAAQVQRWLSTAAGPLAAGPGAARRAAIYRAPIDREAVQRVADQLFEVMERTLDQQPFLAGDHPTIADVALYTYVAHAPEGGISLSPHPEILRWLRSIESLEGFVPMRPSPRLVDTDGA